MRDRYDIVIVGAGPFGLATAYHLAAEAAERSILVVDARDGPGEGSMGASNAMARDVFSSRDNRLLAGSSIAFYVQLMAEHPELRAPVPLLDRYGYLWLLPERLREEYGALLAHNRGAIDAELLGLEELRGCPGLSVAPARWYEGDDAPPPEPITGGLFGRNCGAIAPELLARFYREAAERRGVEFAFGQTVRRLSFEGRPEILRHEPDGRPYGFQEQMAGRLRIARVHFGDDRSTAADRVVVAGGAWSDRILHPLGFATGCSPRAQRLFSVAGPAAEEILDWSAPVHPLDSTDGRGRCPFLILPTGATIKPIFRQRRLWLGGVETLTHPIGTREDPARDGRLDFDMGRLGDRSAYATDLLPAISPYFPALESGGARLESSWGGYYSFSPDGLPVLVTTAYGVTFVGGDSGSGIMKADALGRLAAAACRGRHEARLFTGETYRPERLSLERRDVEPERIIL